MNKLNQACLDYIDAGFALVPLPKASKGPTKAGWNESSECISNKSQLEHIHYGVGLAHAYSSPITCSIDIDNLEKAELWLKQRGVNLDSLLNASDAVQIQSGRHNKAKLIYCLPKGVQPLPSKKHIEIDTVIEFRCASNNGKTVQDVLPPSIHPETGQAYQWAGAGNFKALPELPQSLFKIWSGLIDQALAFTPEAIEGPLCKITQNLTGFTESQGNINKVKVALDSVSANCSYEEWRNILFALKSTGWQCAKQLASDWSQTAPDKWDQSVFDTLWNSAKESGGISIGTLFHKAGTASVIPTITSAIKSTSSSFELSNGQMKIPTTPPPPRHYLFGDCVVGGTMGIMAGLGGTAKTLLMMQIAVHGAIGKPIGNFHVDSFASMLFLGEENEAERDRRFGALCTRLTAKELQEVQSSVICYPAAGKDIRLTWLANNNPVETPLVKEIVNLAEEHHKNCGKEIGLIVFDHARLVMAGDPNAANDVTQLTRVLNEIAIATNSVVMLLAHSPKNVYGKDDNVDAAEVFGSGAFVDNSRAAFVLHTMREKEAKDLGVAESDRKQYVCLTSVKANNGPSGNAWWFKKEQVTGWSSIVLVPVQLYPKSMFPNHSVLTKKIIDLVKANPVIPP
jgi:hypothetical protein